MAFSSALTPFPRPAPVLLQPRWTASTLPIHLHHPGLPPWFMQQDCTHFPRCQAGLTTGERKLAGSTWSAGTSALVGHSKANWWLHFLEIISPAPSSQPQEVKPILRHSADSQLRKKLDRAHSQISCAQLFVRFRWRDVTHSEFIWRKKTNLWRGRV